MPPLTRDQYVQAKARYYKTFQDFDSFRITMDNEYQAHKRRMAAFNKTMEMILATRRALRAQMDDTLGGLTEEEKRGWLFKE